MKCVVLGTSILIEQDAAAEKTEGGILLPDQSKVKPLQGTIVEIGVEYPRSGPKHPLRKGDTVLFDRYAGAPVELEKKQYLVMDHTDILMILEK